MNSTSTTYIRPRRRTQQRRKQQPKSPRYQAPPRVRPQRQASNWLSATMAYGVDGLPGWKDLAAGNERAAPRNKRTRTGSYLSHVSTARFAILILTMAVAIGVYVGHVYATQATLSMLERAKNERLQLNLNVNRLKGTYDRMTSPTVIYDRARALGLEEDIVYGLAITWQAPE